MQFNTTLNRFRSIALLEGISFLVLLLIAMPLKYMADMPLPVKYVGWAHGVLFVLYMILWLQCSIELSWKFKRIVWAFLASFLPFGTFVLERQLKREA
jgi:integral membrane protein